MTGASHPRPGSAEWILDLCAVGRRIDWAILEHRLLEAHRRSETGSNTVDGFKASHAPSSGGGSATIRVTHDDDPEVVDPEDIPVTAVEAAAFALADPVSDPVSDHTHAAIGFLSDGVHALQAMAHRLDRLDRVSDPTPVGKRARPVCKQPYCEDFTDNKRGMCTPCHRWVLRNEPYKGAGAIVPAPVIEARVAARDQKAVHVTGPDAVDQALLAAASEGT